MAERPTPDAVFKRLTERKPTFFYGVPRCMRHAGFAAFPKKRS
jgi:benzoate-CoA ligase